jgi:hypothetical protein
MASPETVNITNSTNSSSESPPVQVLVSLFLTFIYLFIYFYCGLKLQGLTMWAGLVLCKMWGLLPIFYHLILVVGLGFEVGFGNVQ